MPSIQPGGLPDRYLVYISYSHRDKPWHRKLRRILDTDPDVRDRVWDDTKISASAGFAKDIDQHVARARIMIMLGSEHYFGPNSGAAQCETRPALEAHRNGKLDILWFPVGAHSYSSSPVGSIMAATGTGAIPLERLSPREQNKALRIVHQEVRRCLGLAALLPSDLDEAWEIAERGPMKLFMADIHLHRARLFFREAQYPWGSPTADLAAARKLIEKCSYGRRKEELADAERAIGGGGA